MSKHRIRDLLFHYYFTLNDRQDKFSQIVNILRDSTEANWRKIKLQSKIITGERLPSRSLRSMTKIILIVFTTANDSPNHAHCLLMAFSDLKKGKHKHFLKKQRWRVRQH